MMRHYELRLKRFLWRADALAVFTYSVIELYLLHDH